LAKNCGVQLKKGTKSSENKEAKSKEFKYGKVITPTHNTSSAKAGLMCKFGTLFIT
jgi:hypothetical protein